MSAYVLATFVLLMAMAYLMVKPLLVGPMEPDETSEAGTGVGQDVAETDLADEDAAAGADEDGVPGLPAEVAFEMALLAGGPPRVPTPARVEVGDLEGRSTGTTAVLTDRPARSSSGRPVAGDDVVASIEAQVAARKLAMTKRHCTQCGTAADAADRFCRDCGTALGGARS